MAEVKRGDRVSLNTLKRLFYFQDGDGGINLSAGQNEVTVIPLNATDMHLAQINHAIKAEQLTVGWPEKQIEVMDRDSDLAALVAKGRNKIKDWMLALKDDKSLTKQYKISSLEKILKFEKSGANRTSVVMEAEKILGTIGGVSMVEDEELEKVEIQLT